MKINKLITIIAFSFSFLVNIPRIIFFIFREDSLLSSFLGLSFKDTIFRVLSLFLFCFLQLKIQLQWVPQRFKNKRQLVSAIICVLVLIIWTNLFKTFDLIINEGNSTTLSPKLNTFVYLFVLIMLSIVGKTIELFQKSKVDAIEKEQLKQQSLHNELASLKNQINPHFLFNSLNSLSLIVREDTAAAIKFINKLSFLFRYMLQSKNQDVITVSEELKFLESYIFLIKQRYRGNFEVNISISKELYQKNIPTLALQFLMENAVKHNEISKNKPLSVDVFNEDEGIVVKNKLQERRGAVESTNTGLSNLNSRFKLLANKEITISKVNNYFVVKIPLL